MPLLCLISEISLTCLLLDDWASSHMAAPAHAPELQAAVAFVLIDGLGDVHMPDLNHLTPLEAADTKAMDATAGRPAT